MNGLGCCISRKTLFGKAQQKRKEGRTARSRCLTFLTVKSETHVQLIKRQILPSARRRIGTVGQFFPARNKGVFLGKKTRKNRQRQQGRSGKKGFCNLLVRLVRCDFYANNLVLAAAVFFHCNGFRLLRLLITTVISTGISGFLKQFPACQLDPAIMQMHQHTGLRQHVEKQNGENEKLFQSGSKVISTRETEIKGFGKKPYQPQSFVTPFFGKLRMTRGLSRRNLTRSLRDDKIY